MMKVLVTGGAGYVGSHTALRLAEEGFEPIIFDNLSSGRRRLCTGLPLVVGDLLEPARLSRLFKKHRPAAVLHFASLIQVGESYANPHKYYRHNLITTLNLLEAMVEAGVRKLIFSSSAAVYGVPREIPIAESHPLKPANPYGWTKYMIETMLRDYDRAYGLKSISLRYFNAAGADPEGRTGECHEPETHLVPNIILSLLEKKPGLTVFGGDFPTEDGTAVRDYIHVSDLAEAHVLGLKHLISGGQTDAINLGTNKGYSVLEVIRKTEEITGRKVPFEIGPRRMGDVPVLLASKEKASSLLGWKPELSALETIIQTAWEWHSRSACR
jgi:UDP-glucose-4-epimerase GalE